MRQTLFGSSGRSAERKNTYVGHANRPGGIWRGDNGARCLPARRKHAERHDQSLGNRDRLQKPAGRAVERLERSSSWRRWLFVRHTCTALTQGPVGATSGLTGCRDGGWMGETYRDEIACVSCMLWLATCTCGSGSLGRLTRAG